MSTRSVPATGLVCMLRGLVAVRFLRVVIVHCAIWPCALLVCPMALLLCCWLVDVHLLQRVSPVSLVCSFCIGGGGMVIAVRVPFVIMSVVVCGVVRAIMDNRS